MPRECLLLRELALAVVKKPGKMLDSGPLLRQNDCKPPEPEEAACHH
jgi:hypothetical protein